ncbi:Oidioi.mRNA.OKI2018_I69.XSR.g16353.t1.cds [Oikopleura dioica]|uniref:Oidioi.mRNA.OKI2018_I69.XSR.g16353.t1.cds n=1 Tax=Oikopleura dioica TaxID=34765 RepID=A0ABN7SJT3_OIKDI|nr:Oidioi.mRNA.OKI2018_I69.XSR.g16353.t1.cds [Oikopleura dioica]
MAVCTKIINVMADSWLSGMRLVNTTETVCTPKIQPSVHWAVTKLPNPACFRSTENQKRMDNSELENDGPKIDCGLNQVSSEMEIQENSPSLYAATDVDFPSGMGVHSFSMRSSVPVSHESEENAPPSIEFDASETLASETNAHITDGFGESEPLLTGPLFDCSSMETDIHGLGEIDSDFFAN